MAFEGDLKVCSVVSTLSHNEKRSARPAKTQIIEESIAHHEQVCAHLDQVKEHIKRSRQTADEAWRVLNRASTTLHPKLGEASVPTLWE